MRRVQVAITNLIITLSLVFNVERYDFIGENDINLDTDLYVFVIVIIIALILMRALWRIPGPMFLIGVITSYLLYQIITNDVIVGGSQTYFRITELAFLSLVTFFAYRLIEPLKEFARAIHQVSHITVGQNLKDQAENRGVIDKEMYRSRHDRMPLSIVVVKPDKEAKERVSAEFIEEVQRYAVEGRLMNYLASPLNQQLRPTDIMLTDREHHRLILLCPNTSLSDAKHLADILQLSTHEELAMNVSCGVSSFPDDALTYDDLVRAAESHMRHKARPIELIEKIDDLSKAKA